MPRAFAENLPAELRALGPVAVMDGTCALCSFGARMLHRWDRSGDVRILPVQSDPGRRVMRHFGLDAADPETWLFLDNGKAWRDAEAILAFARRSGGAAALLAPLILLPRPVRAGLYRLVARHRYRLFGRADLCSVPDAGLQARVIR